MKYEMKPLGATTYSLGIFHMEIRELCMRFPKKILSEISEINMPKKKK